MAEDYVCRECGQTAVEIRITAPPGRGMRCDRPRAGVRGICPDPRCHNSTAQLNGTEQVATPERTPGGEHLLVRGCHYAKQALRIAALRERGELREAVALAIECVAAAEGDVKARVRTAAEADGLEGSLGPPPPSVTWQAAQLCRDLEEYKIEIALIERWLEHTNVERAAATIPLRPR